MADAMKITDALDRFLLQLDADGRSVHTIEQYRRHIRLLARWGAQEGLHDDLREFEHETVAQFLVSTAARTGPDGSPKKASSMNALRSSLRVFFKYACEAGWTEQNAARLVRRAHCGPPPPRGLTDEEQGRLMATLAMADGPEARRDHALFHLMLATGIRLGSALALDVGDVDLDTGEVRVRHAKWGREQTAYLGGEVVGVLREFLGDRTGGPLFATRPGRRLSHRQAQRRLGLWLERAAVRRVGPHALRHSFAADLYRRTGDVLLVKEALGHRSIGSSMVYTQVSASRLRAAVGSVAATG